MNYPTTELLLDEMQNYFDIDDFSIVTESKDYRGRPYRSDFVTLIEKQNVRFEVFDNEIIVSYFTDHVHFEDYTSELSDSDPDYIHRAIDFLKNLFTLPLKRYDYYKANKLIKDKYCFIKSDGTEEFIGGCWYGLVSFFNPFAKKKLIASEWRFDKDKKCFVEYHK